MIWGLSILNAAGNSTVDVKRNRKKAIYYVKNRHRLPSLINAQSMTMNLESGQETRKGAIMAVSLERRAPQNTI